MLLASDIGPTLADYSPPIFDTIRPPDAVWQRGDDPNDYELPHTDAFHGPSDSDDFDSFTFEDTDRWSSTATNGNGLGQGDPTTLTWSFVPDGTSIPGSSDEPTSNSNLIAFLNGIYGEVTADSNFEDELWFGPFDDYLNRFGEISGLSYVYQPTDDGAAFPESFVTSGASGSLGVRGDLRISGHSIDGEDGSNTLAYNFFPNTGDMVIDTDNAGFYGNTNNNSINLRNVLAHEHGHGLGLGHVCPLVSPGRLMEPFINTSFDGPQFDDILATQRGYGDAFEKNGGNDSTGTATVLGTLDPATPIRIGTQANDEVVLPTDVDLISIDDDSDTDVFSFTTSEPGIGATITLIPRGPTYLSGPQNSDGSCSAGTSFNASNQSDLTLEFLNSSGTVVATANANGLGGIETIDTGALAQGTFFVRVTGAANAAQMYELQIDSAETNFVNIVQSGGSTDVSETGATDTYTIGLNTSPTDTVTIQVTADSQVEISTDGTNFTNSFSLDFSDTSAQTVTVRAIDDPFAEGLHLGAITHEITSSSDPAYPTSTVINDVVVNVTDNDLNAFVAQDPLGSLVSSSTISGSLSSAADSVEFEVSFEAEQMLAANLSPSASVTISFEVVGVAGPFSSPSPGEVAVMPSTAIPADGTYTLRISSDGQTDFDLEAWLNTALESQVGDSFDGNELAIDDSFAILISGQPTRGRYAVQGFSDAIGGSGLQFNHFNDPTKFVDISGSGTLLNVSDDGRFVGITTSNGNEIFPSGSSSTFSINNNGGIVNPDAAIPFENGTLPSGSFGTALLPFWDDLDAGTVYFQDTQVDGIDALIVQWEDNPHFDVGGSAITFQIQVLKTGPVFARYAYQDVILGNVNFDGGASATIGYQNATTSVEFSRNTASLVDGDVLELVSSLVADIDEYTIDLTGRVNQPIDVLLAGLDGADFSEQTLELLDVDGESVLATATKTPVQIGTDATNFDLGIFDFVVPADGVYTIRLSSSVEGEKYNLVVTDSLSFDAEPNNTDSDPLRNLGLTQAALGHLNVADDQDDLYLIDLTLGQSVTVQTATPLDAATTTPVNDLDPEILIVHPDGVTPVASDSDSADGKNALTTFIAPADGTYQVRVSATSGVGAYWVSVEDTPVLALDFGDAPSTGSFSFPTSGVDAASHEAIGPRLGAERDTEADGQPDVDALGDDDAGIDDEDGVMFGLIGANRTMAAVNIDLQNVDLANPNDPKAIVDAWIDFNRNGNWNDAGEHILDNIDVIAGIQTLNFTVPTGVSLVAGDTYARVRLSTAGNLAPTGAAADGEVEDYLVTIESDAVVTTRGVAYAGATANYGPDAIDPSKTALISGDASNANYTNSASGLNRVVIDIANRPTTSLSATDDFEFRVGNTNDPDNLTEWEVLSATSSIPLPQITLLPDATTIGTDRITLDWPDETIKNTWLQVRVKATPNTGLVTDDVFYFGNQVGDVNGGTAVGDNVIVNATDVILTRFNQSLDPNDADIENEFDITKDGLVNATDVILMRFNQALSGGLLMISV